MVLPPRTAPGTGTTDRDKSPVLSLVSAIAVENCGDLNAFEHLARGEGLTGCQAQGCTIGVDFRLAKHRPGAIGALLECRTGHRTVRQAIDALGRRQKWQPTDEDQRGADD